MGKIKIIIFILAGLMNCSIAFAQNLEETKPEEFHFTAQIISITKASKSKPSVHLYNYDEIQKIQNDSLLIVDVDSRWIIKTKIMSTEGQKNILKNIGKITFAIHSPVKLLACSQEEAIGKTFSFKLIMDKHDDKNVSFNLVLD